MSLVQSIALPTDAGISSQVTQTEHPNRVFRGTMYALAFQCLMVFAVYAAWHFFSHWRH